MEVGAGAGDPVHPMAEAEDLSVGDGSGQLEVLNPSRELRPRTWCMAEGNAAE
ncbi:MAG: hypothetical protein HKO63_08085 [Acidimicrobiia bacterium]|nr:hypothetical protein [Acidimicrobiia bacterium]NNL98149.1 hypothetical protein [Acidimicrobiia bacterium]